MSKSAAPQPQPLPSQKIITLLESQIDASQQENHTNGTYTVNLKEQLVLNDGDSIGVKSAFIDTTATNSTFIRVLPEESEVTITHGLYFSDSQGVSKANPAPDYMNRTIDITARPDGRNYILQNQQPGFVNTELFWTTENNPGAGGTTNFSTKLIPAPVTPAPSWKYDYTFDGSVGYVAPTAPNTPVTAAHIQGLALVLVSENQNHYFKIYPEGYIAPAGGPTDKDHIATMTTWSSGTKSGWQITAFKDAVTAPLKKWIFSPNSGAGVNYFSDEGQGHYVVLDTARFAFDNNWQPENTTFPPQMRQGQYPAIKFNFWGQDDNLHSIGLEWFGSKYAGKPTNYFAGATQMEDTLGKQLSRKEVNRAPSGAYLTREWTYYNFTQYIEPVSGETFLPPIVFDTTPSRFPYLTFYYPGTDTGWMPSPHTVVIDGEPRCPLTAWNLLSRPVNHNDSVTTAMTMRTYNTKITVPPGDYTYDGLAKKMTDLLNVVQSPVQRLSNNPDGVTNPDVLNLAGYSSSRLFTSTYDLAMQQKTFNGTSYPYFPTPEPYNLPASDRMQQPYWVDESGNYLFQFNTDNVSPFYYTGQPGGGTPGDLNPNAQACWCGASSVSVIYDESSNQFKIAQAHSSIYGPIGTALEPGQISVRQTSVTPALYPDGSGSPGDNSHLGELVMADKAGGIFITNMQPASLFINKMKFNPSMFVSTAPTGVQYQNFQVAPGARPAFSADFVADAQLSVVQTHKTSLVSGQNITGLFVGADALVTKNLPATAGDQPDYFRVQNVEQFIEDTNPITVDGDSIIIEAEDDPYFQIEISGINSNELFGQANKNSLIQSITGKYFSSGSFTQTSESDGFTYYHKGEPLVIRSLRVRVLDSVGEPQASLGPNTAVVLQISSEK